MISYFDPNKDLYVFCGRDPLPPSVFVSLDCLLNQRMLEIKIRTGQKNLVDQLFQEQVNRQEYEDNITKIGYDLQSNSTNTVKNNQQKSNRVKERKISEVIEKVALWRRLYSGFYDENGKFVNMPLEEAANKVGISKKTLDDYLLQIRCGKKYGFNFNSNANQRIGILRTFVKQYKDKSNSNQQQK
ncbi:hypothetical protein IMG5_165640 [Ichthyophthirius multifiliis]|uniref:Uncharacterized protein n=1 Tax=Ichthyophthirius multifiliis TaxID=5932 RepID=G0R0M4_ICHMU|nr:hypothetical protein IMG5_165640 [Ichthyophthirius multifiliis]EGR28968.1 hypothetical protein IMG5_165640 [Ichthyophthirius multifiliis]|eukprot:XP_004030204.1 hypothetical protein IMG5_165640 [Ichthyophthirius multifiliis]